MVDSKRRASLYLPGPLCGETVGAVIRELSFGVTERSLDPGTTSMFARVCSCSETMLEMSDGE